MGTHLRVLSESYPMNTNMISFQKSLNLCILVLWTKVASALEGLTNTLFANIREGWHVTRLLLLHCSTTQDT